MPEVEILSLHSNNLQFVVVFGVCNLRELTWVALIKVDCASCRMAIIFSAPSIVLIFNIFCRIIPDHDTERVEAYSFFWRKMRTGSDFCSPLITVREIYSADFWLLREDWFWRFSLGSFVSHVALILADGERTPSDRHI